MNNEQIKYNIHIGTSIMYCNIKRNTLKLNRYIFEQMTNDFFLFFLLKIKGDTKTNMKR